MANGQFKNIKDFYLPVLQIIRDLGGKAKTKQIYEEFLARYEHQLDHRFFTEIRDGDQMWRDWVNRAGYQLRVKGYIIRPTTGLWELTDKMWPEDKGGF